MKKSIKKPNNKRLIIIFGVIIFAIIFYLGYVYLLNGSQLFSPTAAGLSIASALFLSFILGLVHGATPDEHTWPITFSYAVGAMTTRNGAKAGLLFSAGFTFQRALMSELAFLVLAPFLRATSINGIIYLIVGSVMAISGFYVLRRGLYPHLHAISHALHKTIDPREKEYEEKVVHEHMSIEKLSLDTARPIPLKLTVIHGLVAGFGFGAFAIILYTVIAPIMPNAYVAWIPGALFGVGTMIMQVIFGAVIGKWMRMRRYTEKEITFIGRETSGNMLAYGGIAFVFGGLFLLTFPSIANFSIGTGIGIPNLDSINLGLILVVITVIIVSIPSYWYALKKVKTLRKQKRSGKTSKKKHSKN